MDAGLAISWLATTIAKVEQTENFSNTNRNAFLTQVIALPLFYEELDTLKVTEKYVNSNGVRHYGKAKEGYVFVDIRDIIKILT